jgi:Fe2+ transport system protein FeoA
MFQNQGLLTCLLCGHRFDPAVHLACQGCPLQKGCSAVCCPACGYQTVDPSQSGLARTGARFAAACLSLAGVFRSHTRGKRARGRRRRARHGANALLPAEVDCTLCQGDLAAPTLADIRPGCRAKVVGFCQSIPAERRAYLQAYGLAPGYWVTVVQHSPVTVVEVEHTQLALETELACEVQVSEA